MLKSKKVFENKTKEKKSEGFYDSISNFYDEKWWYNNPDSRHVKQYITNLLLSIVQPSSKVLDVGCGTCDTAIKLISKNCNVTGFDLSKKMLSVGLNKLSNKNDIVLIRGNAEFLPFENNQFDYVISEFTLNYINNSNAALNEMMRVLKPQGRLFLIVSNNMPLYIVFWEILTGNLKFVKRLKQGKDTIFFPSVKTKTAIKRYSIKELESQISGLSLKNINLIGTHSISGFIAYPLLVFALFLAPKKSKNNDYDEIDHYVKVYGDEFIYNIFKKCEKIDKKFKAFGRDIILIGEKTKS